MLRFLELVKHSFKMLSVAFLLSAVTAAITYSVVTHNSVPYKHQLTDDNNVSQYYNVSFKKAIKKSRQSTVQIVSILAEQGMISTSSGTYFESAGGYFVVGVAHGIVSECDMVKIVVNGVLHDCKKIIAIDQSADYSIIQVDEISDRTPIQIPRDLPNNKQWIKSFSMLNKVVYTGYPNNIGPMTIQGHVAGFSRSNYAYIVSYAWQGSSGSGVFDHNGKYIGYVVAIDVGQTEMGVQILENVVLVMPAYNIDWLAAIIQAE